MGRAFDCRKEMNGARTIAVVESTADGLRKGMRRNVGVTTNATTYLIFLSIDTVYFLPNHSRGHVPYLQKDCFWK
jgi:hypothetical protein